MVWHSLFVKCGWQHLTPNPSEYSPADRWTRSRKRLERIARKSFDSLVVLVAWFIWLERNAQTFNRHQRTADLLVKDITEEISDWVQARFSLLAPITLALGPPSGRDVVPM
uniref:Uncharacterized protein n=1 Tax=Setaria viridis TaxID=4556 RepID=A0A4U6VLN9_SETVI|nr:hypothetical protein SEVIR_2G048700v2 [Setaria viridis]